MQLNIFPEDDIPPEELQTGIDYPQVQRNALAAEHLVCAHLLTEGYDAFLVASNRPYDVLVDAGNLFRLQVKSTAQAKSHNGVSREYYRFGAESASGLPHGLGLLAYQGRIDGFAFVALDIRRILYMHVSAVTTKRVQFYPQDFTAKETASWNHLKSLLNR